MVDDLRSRPAETSHIEFKVNNWEPKMVGKSISALSNAARVAGEHFAYMVWGIADDGHRVIGTDFEPTKERSQKQPLELWLAQRLKPSLNFRFESLSHPEGRLILLEIPAATPSPIEFDGCAYVRIGSATPKLADYPDRQRALWDNLRPYVWETGVAAQFLSAEEVLNLLDARTYLRMTGQPVSENPENTLRCLLNDRLISEDVGERWNVTNLGAILFAHRLDAFDTPLARKGVRFVAYDGSARSNTVRHRQDGKLGYANGFARLVEYIGGLLPRNEHIGKVFRTDDPLYPDIAIRELVANALIHQDMTITGAGPLIELFGDRLEITNPGTPLVRAERFIDAAPRSRNEALAALMRRMRICEEQGTGIDKVVTAVELFQLPPPDFRVEESATRVILFAPRRFSSMTPDERIRACYQHAVLRYINGERMKNSTLRARFGIEEHNAAQVSQVIKQATEKGLIRAADPERPQAAYVPFWA